jgi:hypothetical protein
MVVVDAIGLDTDLPATFSKVFDRSYTFSILGNRVRPCYRRHQKITSK